ncbi:MAG: HAMP domain-containing sensor histidine kinase [Pseudomonadota bacterium]
MRKRIALALRHKVMAAFVLLLSGGLGFGGLVYTRHVIIQEKLNFIELADDVLNNVLEVRRYEKNFFLYGGAENYELMMRFLSLAEKQLERMSRDGDSDFNYGPLKRGASQLAEYRLAARDYKANLTERTPLSLPTHLSELGEEVRAIGRTLTEEIVGLVKQERRQIDQLIGNQKRSLFYSLGLFVMLSLVVAYYLFFQIFRPMTAIQSAAAEITAGNVREIPPVAGSPEVQSLIVVLNNMIHELDKKSDQLIQREKMAALGTLTSGVAHELNNPLSNISSSTQILLEELDEGNLEFQRGLLSGVEEQVEKARDIVRSLLEFAREREFEPGPVDLAKLIGSTIRLVRGELPGEVNINVDIPFPIEIEADYRRLSQALMNLILNGVQAMEGKGGVLKIAAYYNPKDRRVRLEVEDEGPGIREEDLPHIFDPFFSTKEVGGGTGLGLYVTYGIIQKHRGDISVYSRPGQGAKFVVSLPLKQNSEENA